MKTNDTLKMLVFSSLFLILFALCGGVTNGFSTEVNEYEAEAVIESLRKIGDVSVIPVMSDILSQNNDPSLRMI